MQKPFLKNFCFCIDLVKGNQIYAWAQILFSAYVFYRGMCKMSVNREKMRHMEDTDERILVDQYACKLKLLIYKIFVL